MGPDRVFLNPAVLAVALLLNSVAAGKDVGYFLVRVLVAYECVFSGPPQLKSRLQMQRSSSGEGRGKTLI